MKRLYVSDLDGTLLNRRKQVSDYTVQTINARIERGMLFTVATARMAYACEDRLAALNLRIPAILTNGVFLYDFRDRKYLSVEAIPAHAVAQALDAFTRHGASCFLYTYAHGGISIHYGDENLTAQTQYFSDKARNRCAEVAYASDLAKVAAGRQTVYLALSGSRQQLDPIAEALEPIGSVSYSYYLNIYNGHYCLEAYSQAASKKAALTKLQTMFDADELVVFGDNLNDLPMFDIAHRRYAPRNALPEVQVRATAVIEDCDEDGVARFLERDYPFA